MKAKELAALLMEYPELDVRVRHRRNKEIWIDDVKEEMLKVCNIDEFYQELIIDMAEKNNEST